MTTRSYAANQKVSTSTILFFLRNVNMFLFGVSNLNVVRMSCHFKLERILKFCRT